MTKTKVGIMGGTFDPIHNGHLILAEYSKTVFNLDKILFIPTGKTPHKNNDYISSDTYRYDMTLLAINSNLNYHLSSIEIERKGITYTIDTIKYLQSKFKDVEFYFILGSDSLYNINKWKGYKELLNLCNFIVAKRPSSDNERLAETIKSLNIKHKALIYALEAPLIDISSTQIRDRVKKGLSIEYLVPSSVETYIKKKKLYKD